MESIKIREMKKVDMKLVEELARFLMVSEKADNIEKNVGIMMKQRIKPSLRAKDSKTFVAETESKEIIGFLLVELRYKIKAIVAFMAVEPDHQGAGIGSALMKAGEKYAKSKKIDILESVISKENKISQEFHQYNGFKLFGYTLRKKI